MLLKITNFRSFVKVYSRNKRFCFNSFQVYLFKHLKTIFFIFTGGEKYAGCYDCTMVNHTVTNNKDVEIWSFGFFTSFFNLGDNLLIIFRWGTHLYMSLFPSNSPSNSPFVCLSIRRGIRRGIRRAISQ